MRFPREWMSALLLTTIGIASVLPARAATAPPDTRSQVLAFVRSYADAENRADVAAVMEMYDHSPSLVVVSDGEIVRGWDAVREQSNQVLGKEGLFKISIGSFDVVPLGTSRALAVGPAVVTVQTGQGPVQAEQAETLLLEKRQGKWIIVHEHSSTKVQQGD